MAYDKIITLHGRMDHCIDYVLDEKKTGFASAMAYVINPAKTYQLVTGINCDPETALSDMRSTKKRWDKTGGILGYHVIHSYAPGEVTPDEAHAAGVEFAQRLLGDKYEVVVATHIDRAHLHCHIVFNSVSFVDGKKYRSDFQSYFGDLRGTSNEVSRERGLSVIEPMGHGKHYTEWTAEKQGRNTVMGLVRQDIDAAIVESYTFNSFLAALRRQGYTIKYGSNVKHTAVSPPGSDFVFRLNSMGAGYTEADIRERLIAAQKGVPYEMPTEPMPPPSLILPVPQVRKRYTVRGNAIPCQPRRKLRGFRALYLRYLYLLNGYRRPRRSMPPFAARKEVAKLQRYQKQFRFLLQYRIETDSQLAMLGDALQGQIDLLADYRKELYGRRREGLDVEAELGTVNQKLRSTRRELTICRQITEDIPKIRDQEQLMRQQEQRDHESVRDRTDEQVRKEKKGKWM
jgi:hypothetical protein